MKAPLLTAFIAVALAGCDAGTRTAGPAPIELNAALTEQSQTPIALDFVNSCTGDRFLVTGTVHVVATHTLPKSGGANGGLHINFQAASGEDLTTGTRYQVISNQEIIGTYSGELRYEQTLQLLVKLVGSGPGDNYTFRTRMHVTLTANGAIAVSFSDSEALCG